MCHLSEGVEEGSQQKAGYGPDCQSAQDGPHRFPKGHGGGGPEGIAAMDAGGGQVGDLPAALRTVGEGHRSSTFAVCFRSHYIIDRLNRIRCDKSIKSKVASQFFIGILTKLNLYDI